MDIPCGESIFPRLGFIRECRACRQDPQRLPGVVYQGQNFTLFDLLKNKEYIYIIS